MRVWLLIAVLATPWLALAAESDGTCTTSGTWTTYQRSTGGPDNDYVNDIVFAPDGTAFLATNDLYDVEQSGGGLSIRRPDGGWEVVRMGEPGPSSNTLYALELAPDGILWVGGLKGVERVGLGLEEDPVTLGAWENQPRAPTGAYPLRDVQDILRDRSGALWFTTPFGLFRRSEAGWIFYGSAQPGLESQVLRGIAEDPDGGLWVGTIGRGVAERRGDSWTRYHTGNSDLGNDYVYDIDVDADGRVWVGTGIGVSVREDGVWTRRTSRDSPLIDDDVRAVTVDHRGWIWLGTHGGISLVRNGQWWSCPPVQVDAEGPHAPGPAHPQVISIEEAPDGSIWFGTYGGGVTVFRPEDGR